MKKRTTRGKANRTQGQALAELCLVMPILAMFLAAVMDFGFLLYTSQGLHSAVRHAGMMAVSQGAYTPAQIRQTILSTAGIPSLRSEEISVTTTGTTVYSGVSYPAVEIHVRHTHTLLVPVFYTSRLSFTMNADARGIRVPAN